MAFDWNEYLRVAKDIHTQSKKSKIKDEALLRTAVGRAYFSVINLAAENAIEKHDKSFPKNDFHTSVIAYYKYDYKNPNHQMAGSFLGSLKSSRHKCDYDSSFDGDLEKMLESSIIQAENIKSELAKKTYS